MSLWILWPLPGGPVIVPPGAANDADHAPAPPARRMEQMALFEPAPGDAIFCDIDHREEHVAVVLPVENMEIDWEDCDGR